MLLVPPPDRRSYIHGRQSHASRRASILGERLSVVIRNQAGRRWRWIILAVMVYALFGGKFGLIRLVA